MATAVDRRNAATSRREIRDFKRDKPGRYFAYQALDVTVGHLRRHDVISTWMGDKLADVVSVGTVYRSNFGDRRQAFRALAINGCTYSGVAYLDAGDYVRLRKVVA